MVPWDGVGAYFEEKILGQRVADGIPEPMEGVHLASEEVVHQLFLVVDGNIWDSWALVAHKYYHLAREVAWNNFL